MLRPSPRRQAAGLVARALQGAWRQTPPAPDLTVAELEIAAPLLVMSGAAPLVWRAVKAAPELAASPAGQALRAQAQLASLEDTARLPSLERVTALLNAAGATPLLFKGLVAAGAYAETWLRPSGDFDLMAHPAEIDAARRVLLAHCDRRVSDPAQDQFWLELGGDVMPCKVDLHAALDPAYAADLPTIFARSQRLQGVAARVLRPSPEDHLRLVIEHFLKHGGWRPLWLCDVAALAERAEPGFDWRLCLTDDPRRAAWLAATLAAARELLGGRADHASAAAPAPGWFVPAILRQWENPDPGRFASPRLAALRAPGRWIASRWTGPVSAAFVLGARATTAAPFAWEAASFTRTLAAAAARFATLGFRDRSPPDDPAAEGPFEMAAAKAVDA